MCEVKKHNILPKSHALYIYIYIYICVCVCMCVKKPPQYLTIIWLREQATDKMLKSML